MALYEMSLIFTSGAFRPNSLIDGIGKTAVTSSNFQGSAFDLKVDLWKACWCQVMTNCAIFFQITVLSCALIWEVFSNVQYFVFSLVGTKGYLLGAF